MAMAHCNFLCKDGSYTVELCCCRPPDQGNSCKQVSLYLSLPLFQDSLWNVFFQTSSYCGRNPKVVLADPGDLQVNVLTPDQSTLSRWFADREALRRWLSNLQLRTKLSSQSSISPTTHSITHPRDQLGVTMLPYTRLAILHCKRQVWLVSPLGFGRPASRRKNMSKDFLASYPADGTQLLSTLATTMPIRLLIPTHLGIWK